VASTELTCAASLLLVPLFDAGPLAGPVAGPVTGPVVGPLVLAEVARTRMSVHYETGLAALPVLSVGTPGSVRLPNSLLVSTLPRMESSATIVGGRLHTRDHTRDHTWRVARWWRPSRPRRAVSSLQLRGTASAGRDSGLSPGSLIGRGPGLTPAGDDMVAGALVTAYALCDVRRAGWVAQTRAALDRRRTTAVSQAMLHHAMDGHATPQLAAYIDAATFGAPLDVARRALLDVGHTSGAALLRGVVHTLTTHQQQGAA